MTLRLGGGASSRTILCRSWAAAKKPDSAVKTHESGVQDDSHVGSAAVTPIAESDGDRSGAVA